ncbi:hypothetical protein GGU11DRAFT_754301 [Lentinula aff. detonsa]|nr:hypothetical protein GGU11DRAFT_754301 [Lentinula aff. detonsa]
MHREIKVTLNSKRSPGPLPDSLEVPTFNFLEISIARATKSLSKKVKEKSQNQDDDENSNSEVSNFWISTKGQLAKYQQQELDTPNEVTRPMDLWLGQPMIAKAKRSITKIAQSENCPHFDPAPGLDPGVVEMYTRTPGPNSLLVPVLTTDFHIESLTLSFSTLSGTRILCKPVIVEILIVFRFCGTRVYLHSCTEQDVQVNFLTRIQKDALLNVARATQHVQISLEVRRRLAHSVMRGGPRRGVDVEMMCQRLQRIQTLTHQNEGVIRNTGSSEGMTWSKNSQEWVYSDGESLNTATNSFAVWLYDDTITQLTSTLNGA